MPATRDRCGSSRPLLPPVLPAVVVAMAKRALRAVFSSFKTHPPWFKTRFICDSRGGRTESAGATLLFRGTYEGQGEPLGEVAA
jgi:hypothetical protein